jgi:hypothetical protein
MDCQHTAWLDIIEGPRLVEHCRIQTLLDIGALDSWTQRPCLITFIGHQIKNQYLNKLLQREKNASQSAQVHIDIINPTDVPILLVDCDTDAQNHQQSASINEHCHRTEIRMLEWSNETRTQEELTKTIIERLLFPFTDVICVFADDFGGLPGVATWFKGWNTSKTTFPRSVQPKIIVVVDISNRSAHWDLISTQILMDILASISEGRVALDFQVVASPLWKPLQLMRTLVISAEEVQKVRHDTRTLFSAVHFASLFSSACDHFSHTITEPFDFIRSTRRYISVPDTAPEHLCRFLHLVTSQFDFPYVAIPLIVSSLVLNCAPPGMHGTFKKRLTSCINSNRFPSI